MEYKFLKRWFPIRVSIVLLNSLFVLFQLTMPACRPKSAELIRYEMLIDSVKTSMKKQVTELQHIKTEEIQKLKEEISLFLADSTVSKNPNVRSSLFTAQKFILTFENEKKKCEVGLKQNIKQLASIYENAEDLNITPEKNLEWLRKTGMDQISMKSDYLLNRYHAQLLFIETLRQSKPSDNPQ